MKSHYHIDNREDLEQLRDRVEAEIDRTIWWNKLWLVVFHTTVVLIGCAVGLAIVYFSVK